ncbi:hypothetical protein HK100_005280, partial [Physocladia obscura]
MSHHQNIAVAQSWLDAFNTRNLEKLVNLYSPDCQHVSPKLKLAQPQTNGIVSGHSALRAWWKSSFDKYATLEYAAKSFTADDNGVWIEYLRRAPGEPDTMVAEYLEVDSRSKLISKS